MVGRVAVVAAAAVLVSSGPAWGASSGSRAGYRAGHDAFRSVHATWRVPAISCPGASSPGHDSEAWAGVGLGATNAGSEQVVTRAFCTGTVATYVAYFEVGGIQAAGSAGGFLVAPGDTISASVTFVRGPFTYKVGSTTYQTSTYRFALADRTEGTSWIRTDSSDCIAHACSHSTAVVAAGLPFAGYSALADYGKLTFSNIGIRDTRGHKGSLAHNKHWKVVRLIEVDPSTHHLAASPSSLTHHGRQFSDTWHAY